jgi:hypothetical protein
MRTLKRSFTKPPPITSMSGPASAGTSLLEFRAVLGRAEELFGTGALVAGFDDHEVRRFAFKRFPYKLLAVRREDGITILAVAHNKRDTDYWRDRLKP